jgi:hypothetical protein
MDTHSGRAASVATVAGLANILIGTICLAKASDGASYSVAEMGFVLVLFGAFALALSLLSLGFRETYVDQAPILGGVALVLSAVPYVVLLAFS